MTARVSETVRARVRAGRESAAGGEESVEEACSEELPSCTEEGAVVRVVSLDAGADVWFVAEVVEIAVAAVALVAIEALVVTCRRGTCRDSGTCRDRSTCRGRLSTSGIGGRPCRRCCRTTSGFLQTTPKSQTPLNRNKIA